VLHLKDLAFVVSLLFATLARRLISVASKELRELQDSVGVAVADAPLPPPFL
jgi:hypothetical protein